MRRARLPLALAAAAALAGMFVPGASAAPANEQISAAAVPRAPEFDLLGYGQGWADVEFVDKSTVEQGFDIEKRGPGNSPWQKASTIRDHSGGQPGSTGKRYVDRVRNLTTPMEYCFRVVAWNGSGSSGDGDHRLDCTDPKPPTDLRVSETTAESIELQWTDAAINERWTYLQMMRPDGGQTTVQSWSAGSGSRSYAVMGLEPNTQYKFRVSVQNKVGGRSSEWLSVRTRSGGNISEPELSFAGPLRITPTFPDPGEPFTLSWTVCNYGNTATGSFTDVAVLDGGTMYERPTMAVGPGACYERSVSHPGLAAGTHYWYVYVDFTNKVVEAYENNNRNYYGMSL
jgi:Fibronectin type III domain/CARDB